MLKLSQKISQLLPRNTILRTIIIAVTQINQKKWIKLKEKMKSFSNPKNI